jgi:hypothetical protein
MSCLATPLDEITEVVSPSASAEQDSEMLPMTTETFEVMAEAGVFVPMGIAREMCGPGVLSF